MNKLRADSPMISTKMTTFHYSCNFLAIYYIKAERNPCLHWALNASIIQWKQLSNKFEFNGWVVNYSTISFDLGANNYLIGSSQACTA